LTVPRRAILAAGGAAVLAAAVSGADARKRRRPSTPAYTGGQLGWRYCITCRGLFFSPQNAALGVCLASGKHQPHKAVSSVLYEEGDFGPWGRCTKRARLFSANPFGVCPKGGQHVNDGGRSFNLWSGAASVG